MRRLKKPIKNYSKAKINAGTSPPTLDGIGKTDPLIKLKFLQIE